MGSRASKALLLLTGFALGAAAGGLAVAWRLHAAQRSRSEVHEGGYRFISPLLACELPPEAAENRELIPFRDLLEERIRDLKERGLATEVSVYFRDMNNGPWFSVNNAKDFRPASLLKVPIMIAVFKAAEADPSFLSARVVADLDRNLNELEEVRPASPIQLGATYTVDQLVRAMICQSDNNATALLNGLLDPELLQKTLTELGVGPQGHRSRPGFVSVIGYASFLRVLYNASYLGRAMSEKALSYLAETGFDRGLAAGLPRSVPVAHKFGEAGREDGTLQFHDCGIVYFPGRPYILCVMTRGPAFEPLYAAVAELSRAVYEEVRRQAVLR